MEGTEVTFVVQGPITIKDGRNLATLAIDSIRCHFPGSKVILSTHVGQDTTTLDFDELVFSNKPEYEVFENDQTKTLMSANHQILTTQAGLQKVTTSYVVKTRTDIEFKNRKILSLLENRPQRILSPTLTVTLEPVIVLNWSTVNPEKYLCLPHHPSDQLFAGLTIDVKNIWDAPLYPREYMRWFESHNFPENSQHGANLQRYRTESWIWYSFVGHKTTYSFETSYDATPVSIRESQALLSHNLMVVSQSLAGVQSLKNNRAGWKSRIKMMTYWDWVRISRESLVLQKRLYFDFDSIVIGLSRRLISIFGVQKWIFADKCLKIFPR